MKWIEHSSMEDYETRKEGKDPCTDYHLVSEDQDDLGRILFTVQAPARGRFSFNCIPMIGSYVDRYYDNLESAKHYCEKTAPKLLQREEAEYLEEVKRWGA